MTVRQDEVKRITARIAKCDTRIKSGYDSPEKRAERKEDQRSETEVQRKARLTQRLKELEGDRK